MKSCRSYRSCRSCRAYASDRSCTVHPIDLEDAVDPAELVFQIKFLVKIFHLSSYFVRISKKYFRQNICTVSEVLGGGREVGRMNLQSKKILTLQNLQGR